MKNERCWARKLDDCCSKLSGEHRVSVNAWPGENREDKKRRRVTFERGEIQPDGSVDITAPRGFRRSHTVATLTSNVLCVDHNRGLSPTDIEAGRLTDAIVGFWDLWRKRQIPRLRYNPRDFHIDGPMIERWFIKTVIANSLDEGVPIGAPDGEPGTPCDELVDIAFGLAPPTGHIGLCGAATVADKLNELNPFPYRFMTWQMFDKKDPKRSFIAGAFCFYRGLQFVLNLARDFPPPIEDLRRQPGWHVTQLLQPLRLIQAPTQGLYIHFDWPADRDKPTPVQERAPAAVTEAA